MPTASRPNIVLIHGAGVDGSCWSGVIERLQADGFEVRAPQFPLSSLADDVARLRQVLEFLDGPILVVGHSYGGQILTAPRTTKCLGRMHNGSSLRAWARPPSQSPRATSRWSRTHTRSRT
jgi:hypothetical protein